LTLAGLEEKKNEKYLNRKTGLHSSPRLRRALNLEGRKNSKMPPLYLLRNAGAPLWAPPGSVGVVTGANKGIGLEIAAGLAANGLAVVAAVRSEERGRAAVEAIRARASPETKAVVSFLQLDVASDASVSEFAKKLRVVAPAGGK
jgi:hypothetical protein